jgi:monothiol glutaredoxin
MKGTPQLPECGFSRAVVQVLDLQGVPIEKMKTYNVLEDQELRTGIKEFSSVYRAAVHNLNVLTQLCV